MKSLPFYIAYFGLLSADILLTYFAPQSKWRLLLDPLLMIILFIYFRQRYKTLRTNTPRLVQTALVALILGGFFLIETLPFHNFLAGFSLFLIANISYTIMFYRYAEMNLKRVIPFIIVVCLIAMVLLYYFHDSLGDYFLLASIYLFVMLNCIQAAFLRYKMVNTKSFYQVLIGASIFFIAQVAAALHYFLYPNDHLNLLMIFGFFTSQLLIIQGVLNNDLNPLKQPSPAKTDQKEELKEVNQ